MTELPDNFLLSYTGFDADGNHFIDVETESGIARHAILDRELSLQFDLSKRYCTGWVDFDQMEQKPCADHAIVTVNGQIPPPTGEFGALMCSSAGRIFQ